MATVFEGIADEDIASMPPIWQLLNLVPVLNDYTIVQFPEQYLKTLSADERAHVEQMQFLFEVMSYNVLNWLFN